MRERERLLWSLLIILLLIIAGYMGYNAYRMGRQVREYQEEMRAEALGSEDPQLRSTIEQLEGELRDRLGYDFELKSDPLELTQVIHGKRFLAQLGLTETMESQTDMRLSCTIISHEPAAVIKFQGRSRVLRLGDTINGYKIITIEPKRVLLRNSEETVELTTRKAFDTIEREKSLMEGPITIEVTEGTPASGNF